MAWFRKRAASPPPPKHTIYDAFPTSPADYRAEAIDQSLTRIFAAAVGHAEDRIAWYAAKAGERAVWAKRLRWWALMLFAVGTLAPMLLVFLMKLATAAKGWKPATYWGWVDPISSVPLAEVGYLLLAVAGALVLFDQFFDSSGSWIRFRQTEARLRVLLAELRYTWAELMTQQGGATREAGNSLALVKPLREFVSKVELMAEGETKEWARRFNERIEAFDRNPNFKTRMEGQGTGSTTGTSTQGESDSNKTSQQSDTSTSDTRTPVDGASGPRDNAVSPGLPTVSVRLVIDDVSTIEDGSLQFLVNDKPTSMPPSGMSDLPLEVGKDYRLVATARRGGQPVRSQLDIKPTLDDEHAPLSMELT